MNERERFIQVMPNEKIPKAMNVLFNKWFVKWRDTGILSDAEMDRCLEELGYIANQGGGYMLVREVGVALLEEIMRRQRVRKGIDDG